MQWSAKLTNDKVDSEAILFLSDNVREVDAAISAGMKSLLVDRPGNAPVSEADTARLSIVTSLDQISIPESQSSPENGVKTESKGADAYNEPDTSAS